MNECLVVHQSCAGMRRNCLESINPRKIIPLNTAAFTHSFMHAFTHSLIHSFPHAFVHQLSQCLRSAPHCYRSEDTAVIKMQPAFLDLNSGEIKQINREIDNIPGNKGYEEKGSSV